MIFILTFVSLKYAIALYFAFMCLVPAQNLPVLPFSLLLLMMTLRVFYEVIYKKKGYEWKMIIPYAVLMLLQLLIIPLSDGRMPISQKLFFWRVAVTTGMLVPFVAVFTLNDTKSGNVILRTMLSVMIIAGLYGVFLTQMSGINPYLFLVQHLEGSFNMENQLDWLSAEDRLFGRSCSTFFHPMRWGLFLTLSVIFLVGIRKNCKKWVWLFVLAILVVNVFVCGVRSVLVACMVFLTYYIIRRISLKMIAYISLIVLAFSFVLSTNENLSNYFLSVFDLTGTKTTVKGSSLDMRLDQLNGCFKIISDCEFFGRGYGWNKNYVSLHGGHPILLAFESLIYMVLCDTGMVGVIIWIITFLFLCYIPRKLLKKKDALVCVEGMVISYFVYVICTGDYDYFWIFYFFYVTLIGILYLEEKKEEKTRIYLAYCLRVRENKSTGTNKINNK